jgi:hypothetical protein
VFLLTSIEFFPRRQALFSLVFHPGKKGAADVEYITIRRASRRRGGNPPPSIERDERHTDTHILTEREREEVIWLLR